MMEQNTEMTNQPKYISTLMGMLVIGAVALIIMAVVWYIVRQSRPKSLTITTVTPSISSLEINNDSDLQAAATELDKTNVDEIDTHLKENDADATGF